MKIIHKHIAMSKLVFHTVASRWTLGELRERTTWTGTKSDFLATLRSDPREWFVSTDCDNTDETGQCLGHSAAWFAARRPAA